jgi:hypothetical protein
LVAFFAVAEVAVPEVFVLVSVVFAALLALVFEVPGGAAMYLVVFVFVL